MILFLDRGHLEVGRVAARYARESRVPALEDVV
jgi:hypothetical protein